MASLLALFLGLSPADVCETRPDDLYRWAWVLNVNGYHLYCTPEFPDDNQHSTCRCGGIV